MINKFIKISIIILICCSIVFISGCQNLNKTKVVIQDDGEDDGYLNNLNAAKDFIQVISQVKKGITLENLIEIFGEFPYSPTSGVFTPMYYVDNRFTVSLRFNSIQGSIVRDEEGTFIQHLKADKSVYLDVDQQKVANQIKKNSSSDTTLIQFVEKENSDGIINELTAGDLIQKISAVEKNATGKDLDKLFGKAPKNTSTDEQTKFTYFMGDVEITFFNAPITYLSLSIPNEDIELFFSWVEED